ncbi:hypothetical protein [Romboutsia sp.]|uniref:hypothetical protein n=1 Tax=Romboutsia sp. TaxID=1965302 RepID=UPI003F3A9AD2
MDKIYVYRWSEGVICIGRLAGHNAARSCVGINTVSAPCVENLIFQEVWCIKSEKYQEEK